MGPPSDGTPPGAPSLYDDKASAPKDTAPVANGQSTTPARQQRYGSMDTGASQDHWQERQVDSSNETDPRQRPRKERRPSDKQRICGKCQRHLTGQFVRALGDTYHLECFTCHVRLPRSYRKLCVRI